MAIQRWTDGGLDGDWNDTSNWSGGAAPGNGDTAIIDASSRAIGSNLNQSSVNLARLEIGPNFKGKIGASGNALRIGVSGKTIINGGAATDDAIWLTGTTNPLVAVHVVKVGQGTTDGAIHLDGTITAAYLHSGIVRMIAGTTTALWAEPDADDVLMIVNVGSTLTAAHIFGGSLWALDTSTGTITTLNNHSNANGAANVVIQAGTLTTLNQYHPTAITAWSVGSATATAINAYGGRVNCLGVNQTVTNAAVHNGAIIDASGGSVTFSNPIVRVGSGYAIGSPGQTVQFA